MPTDDQERAKAERRARVRQDRRRDLAKARAVEAATNRLARATDRTWRQEAHEAEVAAAAERKRRKRAEAAKRGRERLAAEAAEANERKAERLRQAEDRAKAKRRPTSTSTKKRQRAQLQRKRERQAQRDAPPTTEPKAFLPYQQSAAVRRKAPR